MLFHVSVCCSCWFCTLLVTYVNILLFCITVLTCIDMILYVAVLLCINMFLYAALFTCIYMLLLSVALITFMDMLFLFAALLACVNMLLFYVALLTCINMFLYVALLHASVFSYMLLFSCIMVFIKVIFAYSCSFLLTTSTCRSSHTLSGRAWNAEGTVLEYSWCPTYSPFRLADSFLVHSWFNFHTGSFLSP